MGLIEALGGTGSFPCWISVALCATEGGSAGPAVGDTGGPRQPWRGLNICGTRSDRPGLRRLIDDVVDDGRVVDVVEDDVVRRRRHVDRRPDVDRDRHEEWLRQNEQPYRGGGATKTMKSGGGGGRKNTGGGGGGTKPKSGSLNISTGRST